MRDPKEEAVENALREVIADQNEGSMLISFVVVACSQSLDDLNSTAYHYVGSDNQSLHVTRGLLLTASTYYDEIHRASIRNEDD